jgi:hypothetical protein
LIDIGDLLDGKLSSSFQGAMDLFFTRYSPQPLQTEVRIRKMTIKDALS